MDIIQEAKKVIEVIPEIQEIAEEGNYELSQAMDFIYDCGDVLSRLVDRLEASQEPDLTGEISIDDTSGIILDMAALNKTLNNIPPPFRQDYAKRIAVYLKYAPPPVGDK